MQGQSSYIQVLSESGVSIFLDNKFKGVTNDEMGGLVIEEVTSGNHMIKITKEGFSTQEERIKINPGEVYSYTVKPFVPRIIITQDGNEQQQQIEKLVGSLKVQSLPLSIEISIPRLNIKSSKKMDEWVAQEVPIGNYKAKFRWNSQELVQEFEIFQGQQLKLFVNMINGEIEVLNKVSIFKDTKDGNKYKYRTIGTQTWMIENLAYLPEFGPLNMASSTSKQYYVYDYDGPSKAEAIAQGNYMEYGVLYNWPAAIDGQSLIGVVKGIGPDGWHLPRIEEWQELHDYLGDNLCNVDSESGFNAVPSGIITQASGFDTLGKLSFYWSSTPGATFGSYYTNKDPSECAFATFIAFHIKAYGLNVNYRSSGMSIRCVKNVEVKN